MHLVRGAFATDDQAIEMALAHALVRRAGRGEVVETLRVYRPLTSVVAFGRRDTHLPGFAKAVAASHEAGFVPVVRPTGGRAVAYTPAALVLDHVAPEAVAQDGMDRRFREFGEMYVDAFRGLGVDARLGEVPGEYCPGAHSVNARGVAKLVGTSQRIVRQAWLFSALVVVDESSELRRLLTEIYRRLEQPFDGRSVGSLSDEVPGTTVEDVEGALVAAYAGRGVVLAPAELDRETVELARELVPDHRVT